MINVGSQYSTSKKAVEMAEKYEAGVWAAVGLHPIHVKTDNSQLTTNNEDGTKEEFDYEKYLELAKNKKVVAIGEMGLDYFHLPEGADVEENKKKQKEVFLNSIKLANEVRKPMIIHCREAYGELLEILKNNPVEKRGVIHCFVGSLKTAEKFIELGYKIGLNGIITYSPSYDKLIKNISLDNIVLETDCPYLNPKPLPRDGRNEPGNVKYVAEKIAEVRQANIGEIIEATSRNAEQVFTLFC